MSDFIEYSLRVQSVFYITSHSNTIKGNIIPFVGSFFAVAGDNFLLENFWDSFARKELRFADSEGDGCCTTGAEGDLVTSLPTTQHTAE